MTKMCNHCILDTEFIKIYFKKNAKFSEDRFA